MRVYISGGITGIPNYQERFKNAETMLYNKGHYPVNPCNVDAVMPPNSTWEDYVEVDLAILRRCEAIYMLYGWEKSKGARREIAQAVEMGIPIYLSAFDVPVLKEGEEDVGENEIQS